MRNQDIDNDNDKKKYGGTVALANDVGDYTIDRFAHLDAAMRPCLQCHQRAGDAVVPVGVARPGIRPRVCETNGAKGSRNHDWLAVGLSSLAMELDEMSDKPPYQSEAHVRRVFKQIHEWALRGRDIEQVVVDVSERFAPFRRKEPIPMFDRRRDEGAPRKFCERLRCGYRQLAAALEYGAGRLVAMRTPFFDMLQILPRSTRASCGRTARNTSAVPVSVSAVRRSR
jgi:hypothetical protein